MPADPCETRHRKCQSNCSHRPRPTGDRKMPVVESPSPAPIAPSVVESPSPAPIAPSVVESTSPAPIDPVQPAVEAPAPTPDPIPLSPADREPAVITNPREEPSPTFNIYTNPTPLKRTTIPEPGTVLALLVTGAGIICSGRNATSRPVSNGRQAPAPACF